MEILRGIPFLPFVPFLPEFLEYVCNIICQVMLFSTFLVQIVTFFTIIIVPTDLDLFLQMLKGP